MSLTFGSLLRLLVVCLALLSIATLSRWSYQGFAGTYSRQALWQQQAQVVLKQQKQQALQDEIAKLEDLLANLRGNNPETIENLLRQELGFTGKGEMRIPSSGS